MDNENWIYTKDKLPPQNQRVLLYISTPTNIELSKFGVWNGKFYETNNSDYSKDEIIAWQIIEPPKNAKEINNQRKVEQVAEKYAHDRTSYELSYACGITCKEITEEIFLCWLKDHIFNTAKYGFLKGYEYAKREKE